MNRNNNYMYSLVEKCSYCGSVVNLVDSMKIYGKSYGYVYVCSKYPQCDSYVGVYEGTDIPLGRLANKQLREMKRFAHIYFDFLWKTKKKHGYKNGRQLGYLWLSKQLQLPLYRTHIGCFDLYYCNKVIAICKPYYDKLKCKL